MDFVPPEVSSIFRPHIPLCGDVLRCILRAIQFPSTRFKEVPVQIAITKPLFAWDCLEDSPGLNCYIATLAE